ncbi:peptidoglycan D,D-transpeptidase FtsI family protein [Sphingomonas crusticola]|uniref:peptidoglycan D,D-transpeptidase FtsI family protein n=1 Tax=Sphingomonas crusticola TaxID=1697973 RepID=UPI001F07BC39|nr:penicillin-binding protein 2 [Sphingomonas crusticola]
MNAPAALNLDRAVRVELRDAAPAAGPLGIAQQRLMGIMLLFMLVTAVIGLRLVQICLFGGADTNSGAATAAERGEILDRNGQPLATTIKLWAIAVNPQKILGDKNALAVKLNQLMPEKSVLEYRRILFGKRKFLYLRQPAPPELAAAVHALGDPGMLLLSESHRLFPQSAMAGHVLGYSQQVENPRTRKEELTGIGVERYFDDDLKAGKSVTLSIDTRVQAALESEIAKRMTETQAVGGAGVILDVHTGEVLAMASLPDINPNAPLRDQANMSNKVTQSTYELGSTFKMLTFANALELGVLSDMSQKFDVSSPLHVGGHTIHDDEPMHRALTVPEVMTYSSNIGTAQIADQIGADRTKAFFRRLGFDQRPSIELRERGFPQFPSYWARTTVMTTAYGHGIAVTPLHLATAYAALANGGILRPATLLKLPAGAQVPGKRVISEATSAKMREFMRLVVLQGTGTNANAAGLRVGGKTGTAEKVVGRGYSKSANITVFAGAFPMDDPRYVVVTILDDAKAGKATYGFKTAGWMTAPLMRRITARVGPLLGIRPELDKDIDVSDLMALLAEKKVPGKNVLE